MIKTMEFKLDTRLWSTKARNLTPYVPGEQPKHNNLCKLNTNENPFPPSPKVAEAIAVALADQADQLRLYPAPESDELRQALAEAYGLNLNQVFVGNGSDEVLALVFASFFMKERPLLAPDISYSFYPVYAETFVGQSLAKAGYVTAVINYRKAPQFIYPEFVKDTAQAIAWSHENADKFFADANRMAVVGHSAGAFNAVAAVSNADFLKPYGLQPSDIKAVVGIAGPYSYDFRKFSSRTVFPEGATPDEVMPDRLLKAGNSGQQPDYLLMTAENDKVVHISNAEKMVKALTDVGVNVSTEEIKGATHASIIAAMSTSLTWVNPVREKVLTYLDQKLQSQPITTKAKAS